MNHLTPVEFVDLLDGRLAPARTAHAGSCRTCGAQADELRRALADAAVPQLQEPSPLFWEHFSARVASAIRKEPAPSRVAAWHSWVGRPAFSVPLAAAVIALVTLAAVWSRQSTVPAGAPSAPTIASDEGEWDLGDAIDEEDDAWSLVRAAAEDIEWDEAQDSGLVPGPGAAARVVDDLTPDERAELAILLGEELRRLGA
jgi:hypothetical protein